MLKIENITYSVEGRPLFEAASATIPAGHKVGLVGRNGTGKTTLFRLIRGELALEGGEISLPTRARIGGVAQEVPSSETSLLDTVLEADTERAALLAEAETAADPHRIAEVQARLTDINARDGLRRAVEGAVREQAAIDCRVVLVPPHALPQTTSGKLSRSRARSNYLQGQYGEAADPVLAES